MSTLASVIQKGVFSALPSAGIPGRLYFATDTLAIYRDNGTSWDNLLSGGAVSSLTTVGSSGAATLLSGVLNVPQYSGGGGGGGLFAGSITVPTKSGIGLTTAYNQSGTFSATDVPKGIFLTDSVNAAGENLEGIVEAYPSVPFTATALFSIPPDFVPNSTFGIVIANTLTGTAMVFQLKANATSTNFLGNISKYNTPTSFNGVVLNGGTINLLPFMWLKLQDDGTNINFSLSTDGEWWLPFTPQVKSSSFLGSGGFNFLGIFVNPQAHQIGSTLMSWTYTTP